MAGKHSGIAESDRACGDPELRAGTLRSTGRLAESDRTGFGQIRIPDRCRNRAGPHSANVEKHEMGYRGSERSCGTAGNEPLDSPIPYEETRDRQAVEGVKLR